MVLKRIRNISNDSRAWGYNMREYFFSWAQQDKKLFGVELELEIEIWR